MTLKTTIISITILFLILPIVYAVPVNSASIMKSEINITVNDPIKINVDKYEDLYFNETTPSNVREFLEIVPPCPWFDADATNVCSLNARYLIIESHNHGLTLNEITISYRTGVCGGHRILMFEYNDQNYYCTNLHNGDSRVVDSQGLKEIVKNRMGIDNYGFKDLKEFNPDWFERNGYNTR